MVIQASHSLILGEVSNAERKRGRTIVHHTTKGLHGLDYQEIFGLSIS
jgi:hypothetical protein